MIAKKFQDVEFAAWDDFVAKSPEAWLYHSHGYLTWLLETERTSRAIAICNDDGTIRSMFQMNVSRDYCMSGLAPARFIQRVINKACRVIGLRSPWELRILNTGYAGFAFSGGISDRNRKRYLLEALEYLDETAARERFDELHIRNVEVAPGNADGSLLAAFWRAGLYEPLSIPARLFARVDLGQPEKEIWSGIDEDCRSEINKAGRLNVECQVDPPDAVDRFYEIHRQSWRRTFGYHHPKEHFSSMTRHFGASFHYFMATHEGKDVAAVVLHCFKDAALYYSGGSSIEGQKVNANNFLLHRAILWAKERGYRWFGVGIFDCFPGRDTKQYSVGKYKAQFVREYFPATEVKKQYSRRAVRRDYLDRLALLRVSKRGSSH